MRVLIVNTRHYAGGGDSTYAFNLADMLRANGHTVSFFAMQGPRNVADSNADLFVSAIDFRALNQNKTPLSALRVLTRSVYSLEARQKFARMLVRVNPDIVHVQNIHAHITPSVILESVHRSIPVVWTLHDYKLLCPNSHFIREPGGEICEECRGKVFIQAARRRCKKGSLQASSMAAIEAYTHRIMRVNDRVSAFLCPSGFLRDKLIQYGFDMGKTVHLPLPLPKDSFHPGTASDGAILFLGRLEPRKGIYSLLEAARLAPRVKIILAGHVEEPLKSRLPDLLPPNVVYAGFQSGPDLLQLQRESSALVFPSIWYENQPMSILETFALGKPVIASDLGGMRELIGAEERGKLVPAGDAHALAEALIWLTEHPQDARRMGENAYQYATQYHSPESHYERVMRIYAKVRKTL